MNIYMSTMNISSVQFSRSIVSNSLLSHGLQHARPPCPSPTPRVYSDSCSLSRPCYPTISSSVIPFSSHLQSFPAAGCFPMSHSLHHIAKVLEFQLQHQSFQWNSNTLSTWCKELTRWKRPLWWGRLKAGREGDDRGWDGWIVSPTWWKWVWASSKSWWSTGKPGMMQSWDRKESDMTEWLNWLTEMSFIWQKLS